MVIKMQYFEGLKSDKLYLNLETFSKVICNHFSNGSPSQTFTSQYNYFKFPLLC